MTIAVDFDGTIVEHKYPRIGEEIPFAIDTIKKIQKEQHRIILWTVREGSLLEEAVAYCAKRGLHFYAVNKDYPEETMGDKGYSRKLKADLFIDDRNLGGIPDWGMIYQIVRQGLTYEQALHSSSDNIQPRKKNLFLRIGEALDGHNKKYR